MLTLRYLLQLYLLAAGLRRYGAIRALAGIELVPDWAPKFLRCLTFYIPRRRGLPNADGERLALALAAMGPAYIKLGQTLATRPDLVGRPLAEGLSTLQDRLPPFPFAKAKETIERELGGSLTDHYSAFEEKPVAAASIAQVHKAVTTAGLPVAVKVLRPDVVARFTRDLRLFEWLAELAERHVREAQRLRLTKVVAKVRETVLREMDLRLEAAAAAELKENMASESGYRLPKIEWDHTTRSVLTLEWVEGVRLADRAALEAAGHDLTALGARVVQVFLTQALRDGFFHADLHQGNLIVQADGTIVAIDFGIMGRLSKLERRFLAEILYGFIRRDYRRVAQIHFDAGYVPRDQSLEEFAQAMRSIADPIMDLPVEEISAGQLLAQLFATTERFSMQTQPQLLLLQRTMVMAEGMALHLNPRANMWQISEPVIERWIRGNLSPEARLADAINTLPRLLDRLPARLERWLSDDEVPVVPMPDPGLENKPKSSLFPFALGLVVGAAILKILAL
ncbi:2-polyprenylphenol 6-hydroxylase [Kordiimonas aestuarii]|uniref:2-polyprenylphenol 6-hydroxylase n=1 Tax=Kordiimonas aestuarii TaxID=1005925 RepID=UPI0021CE4DC6|nr:2-polyprenylphenol 6-hydroxylase [Kordiimonas aestuarii]